MKKTLNIWINWNYEKLTIKECAFKLKNILTSLSESNELFSNVALSKEDSSEVKIDIENTASRDVIDILSNTILDFSKADILKNEKESNPTLEYSRDFGFSFVIKYYKDDKILISFNVIIGSSNSGGISSLNISCDFDFDWFFSVLKALAVEAFVGSIGIRDLPFNKACKQYKIPLGWITYFSKDCEVPIPDDLEGVEYENTDKGKYLILTRDNITKDAETFQFNKNKLLDVMEEIKRRVPEYSK